MQANGITVVRDETYFQKSFNRNNKLSLKAKGLLGLVLDLPPSWDFSIRGIAKISLEGKDAIATGIKELESLGYCIKTRVREQGKFKGYHYTFLETPELPYPGKPDTENPYPENPPQYKGSLKEYNNNKKGGEKNGHKTVNKAEKPSLPQVAIIWMEKTGLDIPEAGLKMIASRVAYPKLWSDTLDGWLASNWTKGNIDGQIERYEKKLRDYDISGEQESGQAPTLDPEKIKEDEELRRLIYGND